ncbi:MAG: hypothetical protein CMN32_05405 [Saprospirales bacterium]|nr:hypothetical protein [Saprospirales bacterium]
MSKLKLEKLWLTALLAVPVVLWLLPRTFFDSGVAICPSKVFFDIECLGCGMTRAVMHLHHLDIDEAVYYNAGVLVVYPALVILWFVWVYRSVKRVKGLGESEDVNIG